MKRKGITFALPKKKRQKINHPNCNKTNLKLINIQLSNEQEQVVQAIVNKENVLCIAKAGSGKSSVALACAKQYFEKHKQKTLIITYNARLKFETRDRIKKLGLQNCCEAHTYHAVAARFFLQEYKGAADDSLINLAIQTNNYRPMDFELVILDEAQDVNELYAEFVQHILKSCTNPPVMLMVGDPFQRIFGFNGAKCDFLMTPEVYFGQHLRTSNFSNFHLTICWRITHEMADFINSQLDPRLLRHAYPDWWKQHGDRIAAWWGEGIQANPQRQPEPHSVKVFKGWGSNKAVQASEHMFLKYGNDEVALLGFSLKNKRSPIQCIVNQLSEEKNENWLVMAGDSNNNSSNNSVELVKNKRVASTIHRFKGLERDGILLCGLDAFIEKLYPTNPLDHFNLWYVACTRARKQLIVNVAGKAYATIRCCPLQNQLSQVPETAYAKTLVQYVPFDNWLNVNEHVFDITHMNIENITPMSLESKMCTVQGRESGTVEDISSFLGTSVTLMLQLKMTRCWPRMSCLDEERELDDDMIEWLNAFENKNEHDIEWLDLLKYSIAWQTVESKYKHYWRQMQHVTISPALEQFLNTCFHNTVQALWAKALHNNLVDRNIVNTSVQLRILSHLVEFHVPTHLTFYQPQLLKSTIDILFNHHEIVTLYCANNLTNEMVLNSQVHTSMMNLMKNQAHTYRSSVLLCNQAQWFNISPKSQFTDISTFDFSFLYRICQRKYPAIGKENDVQKAYEIYTQRIQNLFSA